MAKTVPWYTKYKKTGHRPGPIKRLVNGPTTYPDQLPTTDVWSESDSLAYNYFLNAFRTNAPGLSDQDAFTLTKAYMGVVYLAVHSFVVQASQAEIKLFEVDYAEQEDKVPLSQYEDITQLVMEPNEDETFSEILETIALQYKLTGLALAWTPLETDDPSEKPEEMYVLSTASVIPMPISAQYPQGAYRVQPFYPAGPYATIPQGQTPGAIIPTNQIIRFKEINPFFRWTGYGTLYAISAQIDALNMVDTSRKNAFLKGIDPNFVLTIDPAIRRVDEPEIRRLEAQLQALYAGPQNQGRVFVAPVGGDLKKLSNTPAEMAFQDSWEQLKDFTLAAIGSNDAVAGLTADLSFANLYASYKAFYIGSLNPFLNKIATKFNQKLIRPRYDRNFKMELEGKALHDDQLVETQNQTDDRVGLYTINERRRQRNLPEVPWGEARAVQGKISVSDKEGEGDDYFDEEQDADNEQREIEQNRPKNTEGKGTKGPRGRDSERKSLHDQHEVMMRGIERNLSRGTIQEVKPNGRVQSKP